MIGRADKNGPQGGGINEDVSFTLNATDRHAVAFSQDSYTKYSENDKCGRSSHRRNVRRWLGNVGLAHKQEFLSYRSRGKPCKHACGKRLQRPADSEFSRVHSPQAYSQPSAPVCRDFPTGGCADLGTDEPTDERTTVLERGL